MCRETPCCFYHPILGCQSQPASHPCQGKGSWVFQMSASGWQVDNSAGLISAQYSVYQMTSDLRSSYWGCQDSGTCGNLIKGGFLLTSGLTKVEINALYGPDFFVVFTMSGYMSSYFSIDMMLAEDFVRGQVVAELQADEDRMLLRWFNKQDLDLWVFVRNPPNSDGTQVEIRKRQLYSDFYES